VPRFHDDGHVHRRSAVGRAAQPRTERQLAPVHDAEVDQVDAQDGEKREKRVPHAVARHENVRGETGADERLHHDQEIEKRLMVDGG